MCFGWQASIATSAILRREPFPFDRPTPSVNWFARRTGDQRRPIPLLLSGWPRKSSNFIYTTKLVFPKSLKFMNSGSEIPLASWVKKASPRQELCASSATSPRACRARGKRFEAVAFSSGAHQNGGFHVVSFESSPQRRPNSIRARICHH